MESSEPKLEKRASEDLEMDFDEAVELFSQETLDSMKMMSIIGGMGDNINYACPTNGYCPAKDCKGCTMKDASCLKY